MPTEPFERRSSRSPRAASLRDAARSVRNVHQRFVPRSEAEVGQLIETLSGPDDRLWPYRRWPRMRFDRPLSVGADGGHGPVRYTVVRHRPGRSIWFRFKGPRGFHGGHGFEVRPATGGALLVHSLEMKLSGPALATWPLLFRPLHDALVEDALDNAERELTGRVDAPAVWSVVVRTLRSLFSIGRRRR